MEDKLNEIKNFINSGEFYCYPEYIIEEDKYFDDIEFDYVECLASEEHRWYIISADVYKVKYKGEAIGYLALTGVETLKSEAMSVKDCYVAVTASNVKKVIKESFEIIG